LPAITAKIKGWKPRRESRDALAIFRWRQHGWTAMTIRTNADKLVEIGVQGRVAPPVFYGPFEVSHDGRAESLPSLGGITYNVKVGDPVCGWVGDHIEPGVSAIVDPAKRSDRFNQAFNYLACAGNEAVVVSGGAKGAKGTVVGHHGGVEHVIIDFADRDLRNMTLDDRILIRSHGQGLKLLDFPEVHAFTLSPTVLARWGLKKNRDGTLGVPVTTVVPAEVMGSGIGALPAATGDYDIMTSDPEITRKHGIEKICFGDFVAILDHDNRYGRALRKGAITIGIVIHSDSVLAGHGPGVTTLLTADRPVLKPVIQRNANLGKLLGIGRHRKTGRKR